MGHKDIIKPFRTQGQYRRYTKEMLDQALIGKRKTYKKDLLTIGYCRASSAHQKTDLKRQISVVSNYCEVHGY